MKTPKQTLLAIVMFAMALAPVVGLLAAPSAQALTEEQVRQCYSRWNNITIPNRRHESWQTYLSSGCNVREACGANTVVHEDPNRPITFRCTNPDQQNPTPGTGDSRAVECSILPAFICNAANVGELQNSGIWLLLIWIINILTVGVGIAAVAAIAFAGFLYTTAANDAAQTKKALEMIRNTVIGLVVYALMYAGIQFLIPGGVFGASLPSSHNHLVQTQTLHQGEKV